MVRSVPSDRKRALCEGAFTGATANDLLGAGAYEVAEESVDETPALGK